MSGPMYVFFEAGSRCDRQSDDLSFCAFTLGCLVESLASISSFNYHLSDTSLFGSFQSSLKRLVAVIKF